jgi:ubiquinone/menaquinone biosynthesis C-methylase UbiE
MHSVDRLGAYVLGHSDQELARLERQGRIFGAETGYLLGRAGLWPGMNVLDVGCGVGDVALAVAEIVGAEGSVLGIDRSEEALSLARARAARAGHRHLRFEKADLYSFNPETRFNAVVGRFILMHVPDAVGALRWLERSLLPGATIAFIEMDIDQAGSLPNLTLLAQCRDWIATTYRRVGVEPNMGSALYAAFRAAGLHPSLAAATRIESSGESPVYEFAAQTLRSLLPKMEELGIATAADVGIDTLASRLRDEAAAGDHCIMMPRLVAAWATTPSA